LDSAALRLRPAFACFRDRCFQVLRVFEAMGGGFYQDRPPGSSRGAPSRRRGDKTRTLGHVFHVLGLGFCRVTDMTPSTL
jgi:hypothetical protein